MSAAVLLLAAAELGAFPRPRFHYTRCSGEMNDPNGLQYRLGPDGTAVYHMFYQSSGGG